MSVHETAKRGFVRPEAYERGRAGYPEAALDVLAIDETTTVLDLGCGTGKLTRQLVARTPNVIGVDPLADMIGAFHRLLPDSPAVLALAEALPLRSASVDLITCASVFHWLDHEVALPEMHRVLRPRGRLAIIWNRRDSLDGWAHEFWQITEAYRGDTPGYRTGRWRDALESSPRFGPIEERWFDHVQRTDVDGLVARVASVSFIELLPSAERERVLATTREFLETHPETAGRETIDLPYRTALYVVEAY